MKYLFLSLFCLSAPLLAEDASKAQAPKPTKSEIFSLHRLIYDAKKPGNKPALVLVKAPPKADFTAPNLIEGRPAGDVQLPYKAGAGKWEQHNTPQTQPTQPTTSKPLAPNNEQPAVKINPPQPPTPPTTPSTNPTKTDQPAKAGGDDDRDVFDEGN